MKVERLAEMIGADFYTGVPDSQLKALCNYLMNTYGIDRKHHIIAANEGNCTAIAAGYHLAEGKVPVVYMQNSGEGNIINPVASLLSQKVYAIPMLFIIGWRGESDVHDEPQHIYQGEVTLKLLDDMDISYFVIGKETSEAEVAAAMENFLKKLSAGGQAAFVVRRGALEYGEKVAYANDHIMPREEVIGRIMRAAGESPVISTTGKPSRELFELRERSGMSHKYDFLTVGSMGHASSIALGISLNKPETRVWCIDGDGAALMHMGSMAVIGANSPNMVHIVLNNEAHETVGGMPTVASKIDFAAIAAACGYSSAVRAETFDELDRALKDAALSRELSFIEVKCALGSRPDLGRPTTSPVENKRDFMEYLAALK